MVQLTINDLEFILKQIKIAEAHAAGGDLAQLVADAGAAVGAAGTAAGQAHLLPYGLRTVDGSYNNLLPGRETWGAADQSFVPLGDKYFVTESDDSIVFGAGSPGQVTFTDGDYSQMGAPSPQSQGLGGGTVVDADPRTISNLIVDQTSNNFAAIMIYENMLAEGKNATRTAMHDANGNAILHTKQVLGLNGQVLADIGDPVYIYTFENIAPDIGDSAPYNSMFTLFGQFFDHGLDLVAKGGNGTVYIPLQPDDPLYVPGSQTNFMTLTRSTLDANGDVSANTTTPWVDQNQTYTSHPSHQVFLREYTMFEGKPVATGNLLNGDRGLPTWGDVKEQARTLLGINLTDADVGNVPLLRTDQYGNFIPDPVTGFAQLITGLGADGVPNTADDITISGTPGAPVGTATAVRTAHAFLDDIAHAAVPVIAGGVLQADGDSTVGYSGGFNSRGQQTSYDNELLDAHYITGDGRGNENIGLTSIHHVFHSEHNHVVADTKQVILSSNNLAFINEWLLVKITSLSAIDTQAEVDALVWDGERLFQAGRFTTEMEYQHLVFEEFARKMQPDIDAFVFEPSADVNPAIFAEFAHAVYRFGHSMLNENIDRLVDDGDGTFSFDNIALFDGFLNPLALGAVDANGNVIVDHDTAAGAVIRGMSRQGGNAIDEFVTDVLRNQLVGIPLDLAALNLARGRDVGLPTLNQARAQFYQMAGQDSQLKPYTSWVDFALNMENPESIINFIAAYGRHDSITNATTLDAKRAAAVLLVLGGAGAPADRLDFLNATGEWATRESGLNEIDLWIGGLAEKKMDFGGMLGSTFSFVFELQLENLQDADRFYYLSRVQGLNLLNELENNSLTDIIIRNTDFGQESTALPGDIFATPAFTLELDIAKQQDYSPITAAELAAATAQRDAAQAAYDAAVSAGDAADAAVAAAAAQVATAQTAAASDAVALRAAADQARTSADALNTTAAFDTLLSALVAANATDAFALQAAATAAQAGANGTDAAALQAAADAALAADAAAAAAQAIAAATDASALQTAADAAAAADQAAADTQALADADDAVDLAAQAAEAAADDQAAADAAAAAALAAQAEADALAALEAAQAALDDLIANEAPQSEIDAATVTRDGLQVDHVAAVAAAALAVQTAADAQALAAATDAAALQTAADAAVAADQAAADAQVLAAATDAAALQAAADAAVAADQAAATAQAQADATDAAALQAAAAAAGAADQNAAAAQAAAAAAIAADAALTTALNDYIATSAADQAAEAAAIAADAVADDAEAADVALAAAQTAAANAATAATAATATEAAALAALNASQAALAALQVDDGKDPLQTNPLLAGLLPLVERRDTNNDGQTDYLRYNGVDHVAIGGTGGNDTIISGEGDDTLWGWGGDDTLEAGYGVDIVHGGEGDDIITNAGTDIGATDFLHGEGGNDVINGGSGLALIFGNEGNDFILAGPDGKHVLGGVGNDFVRGGDGVDFVMGNEGDDWLEGGGRFDTLAGENSELFFNSPIIGHDVMNGGGNDTDYDAESGDDIMFASEGIQRFNGMAGFDWGIHKGDTYAANSDLGIPTFATQEAFILRDRFDLVEGLSGWIHNDVLTGRSEPVGARIEVQNTAAIPGADSRLDSFSNALLQKNVDLINGLDQLVAHLPRTVAVDAQGNTYRDENGNPELIVIDTSDASDILLGGGGNDIITGLAGNDIIDGDKWLNVRIRINDANGNEIATADGMTTQVYSPTGALLYGGRTLDALMLDRTLNPGQLEIVREILDGDANDTDTDIAVFTDTLDRYTITLNGDGSLTVDHTGFNVANFPDPGDGVAAEEAPKHRSDGTDRLFNIEVLRFWDGANGYQDFTVNQLFPFAATGNAIISDTTPTEGQLLTVDTSTIADRNGLGAFSYQWQRSTNGTTWVNIAGATSATFAVPDAAGTALGAVADQFLRVRVIFTDGIGDSEVIDSAATARVGVNYDASARTAGVNFSGTRGDNVIVGSAFNDTLQGQQGDDAITGGSGNDAIGGGVGIDTAIYAGAAINFTFDTPGTGISVRDAVGAEGNDTLQLIEIIRFAGVDYQVVFGSTGADTALNGAAGAAGSQIVFGRQGVDTMFGGQGDDILVGGGGNDTAGGGAGNDILHGDAGNDTLSGDDGDDTLMGGEGNDVLAGGAGIDTLLGGGGTDTAVFNGPITNFAFATPGVGYTVTDTSGAEGSASLTAMEVMRFAGVNYTIVAGTTGADNAVNGASGAAGSQIVFGRQGADTLFGGDGADILVGGSGNDRIFGGNGDDFIVQASGEARDFIDGGAGTDTYILNGDTTAETFHIYTRAAALAAGITGLNASTEIVITRNGTNNASIMAELDNIEEIKINSLLPSANNGDGVVNSGLSDGDTIVVVGDFTTTSLDYSTIRVQGSTGNDTIDISGLTSDHRLVFDSNGGTDTLIGDTRPQDVMNGITGVTAAALTTGGGVEDDFELMQLVQDATGISGAGDTLEGVTMRTGLDMLSMSAFGPSASTLIGAQDLLDDLSMTSPSTRMIVSDYALV